MSQEASIITMITETVSAIIILAKYTGKIDDEVLASVLIGIVVGNCTKLGLTADQIRATVEIVLVGNKDILDKARPPHQEEETKQ